MQLTQDFRLLGFTISPPPGLTGYSYRRASAGAMRAADQEG